MVDDYDSDDVDERPRPRKKDVFMGMDWGQIGAVGAGLALLGVGALFFKPTIDQMVQQQNMQRLQLQQQQQLMAQQQAAAQQQMAAQQNNGGNVSPQQTTEELNLEEPGPRRKGRVREVIDNPELGSDRFPVPSSS